MTLFRLVYTSRPFGFDDELLAGILVDARRANARDGITGALIARHDLFVQYLEGSEAAVDATYARIAADDRHVDLRLILREPVAERLFPDWAMRDDPAHSWMWSREAVREGAAERATPAEAVAIFERLATGPSEPPAPRCPFAQRA